MPVFGDSDGHASVRELERRDFIRRCLPFVFGAILLAGISVGGLRGYTSWRHQHLVRQAQGFVARGEFASGVLVARRLLELNPNDLAACQAMAEMAEKSGKADAITWRQKIVHLTPGKTENQLALARVGLRFGQADLAEAVLNAVPETARVTAEYHELAGGSALLQQQPAKAEEHFAAALKISPANPHLSLNLATLHLVSPAAEIAAQARETLIGLTSASAVRTEALRALSADALAHRDHAEAANWTTALNAESDATFADALLQFEAFQSTEDSAAALQNLQQKAAASVATAAELITWLNRHERARVALAWSESLPKEIRAAQPVPLALAESYSFLQDWSGLQNFVHAKNWGECEALRLAVESHALHRLSLPDRPSMETETLWQAALKAAQNRPDQLIAIARLAEGWGYNAAAEEAWWNIANSNNNQRPALSALQRFYKAKQDTRGLLRIAKRALELNPEDLVAANNYASLGLILNADSTARRLAFRLHSRYPANRAFAATYAFALHTEGKFAEGLHVMESLKDEELRHPAIAAYYVIMLVESGKLERARAFLTEAKSAALLPEEQQRFTAATRKLLPTG